MGGRSRVVRTCRLKTQAYACTVDVLRPCLHALALARAPGRLHMLCDERRRLVARTCNSYGDAVPDRLLHTSYTLVIERVEARSRSGARKARGGQTGDTMSACVMG